MTNTVLRYRVRKSWFPTDPRRPWALIKPHPDLEYGVEVATFPSQRAAFFAARFRTELAVRKLLRAGVQ